MYLEFFAGSVAGAAGVLSSHPFDTIKVRLQSQTDGRYSGMLHCVRCMVREEGGNALFKGITPPLASQAVTNAIAFGVHGTTLRLMPDQDHPSSHLVAGVATGLVQSLVACPVELAKTRLQLQGQGVPDLGIFSTRSNADVYRGPVDCLRQVYRIGGLAGLYRGMGLTAMRDGPGFGAYFLTYESLTKAMDQRGSDHLPPHAVLFAGGLAGISSWVVTYPVDVVKTRFQADGVYPSQQQFKSGLDCFRATVSAEGYAALLKGFWPTIGRAFIFNAVTFWALETVYKFFGKNDKAAVEEATHVVVDHTAHVLQISP